MRIDPENFPHHVPVYTLTINHGQLGDVNVYVCSTYNFAKARLLQYIEYNWPTDIEMPKTNDEMIGHYFNLKNEHWSINQHIVQTMWSPVWMSQKCSFERGSMGLRERKV